MAVLATQACQRVEVALTTDERAVNDDQKIRDYLAAKGVVNYARSNAGTYVVIDSAQPAAPLIRNGQFVFLRYRGYFPGTEATAFDSNTVATQPLFSFIVGQSGLVINGWQDAIKYFRPGERGRMFIPSGLAYGATGNARIPANQILVFDIKILRVQ